jgi:hypothetical protein
MPLIALAVLMAVGGLAGSIGWAARDRAARQAALEAEADLALKEAERWQQQGKYPEALSAAKRAEGLLAGGGSDELRQRVQELRKDLEMVLRLEEIRSQMGGRLKDDKFDYAVSDQEYAAAFQEYGVDVLRLAVEDAAQRLRARTIVLELAAALDDWTLVRANAPATSGPSWQHLGAVARAADRDPWRTRLREAMKRADKRVLTDLAASDDGATLPPSTVVLLGASLRETGAVEQVFRGKRVLPSRRRFVLDTAS